MIKKWETVEKKHLNNLRIFDVYNIKRKHPDWDEPSDFVLLDSPSWVNIIPITKDLKVVLIEQYRHGTDDITLEIPGGLVEKFEDPRVAGMRECREETGFAGKEDAIYIGETTPNPAFLNNICYSFVWFNCKKHFEQELDGNEDINVLEVPLTEIRNYILTGKINHSLVLNAFFFYHLKFGL